jgi:small redox-active disulfide protein 2
MKIQILGIGCAKCARLAENTRQAADRLGIHCEIEKVTDIGDITAMGVMLTPALVVDGKVRVAGRVPDPEAIRAMLGEHVHEGTGS